MRARAMAPWALCLVAAAVGAQERRNWFGDPFFQVSSGVPGCPAPLGPLLTEEEQRREAHWRIERGTSCWLAGRCADSNAFRGDGALAARVGSALAALPGIAGNSLWVTVQARWVFLQGCAASAAQAAAIEAAVRSVAGVETVVPALDVGVGHPPRYRTADR